MTYQFTPEQEAWLRDLETTEEPQARGSLHKLIASDDSPAGYCCLGRACIVLGIEKKEAGSDYDATCFGEESCVSYLPEEGVKALRLASGDGTLIKQPFVLKGKSYDNLTELNDCALLTFRQIAAYIRSNPENVFLPIEEEKQ